MRLCLERITGQRATQRAAVYLHAWYLFANRITCDVAVVCWDGRQPAGCEFTSFRVPIHTRNRCTGRGQLRVPAVQGWLGNRVGRGLPFEQGLAKLFETRSILGWER